MIDIHTLLLFFTAFLATGIEVVEMMTIILAVGMTAGWYATLLGAGTGFLLLAGIVAALGSALAFVPIDMLRAIVGILLLLFGIQWFRKGIFRISCYGLKAAGEKEERPLQAARAHHSFDWTAFVLSFKGVLLEGLEVILIVVAFGAATHRLGTAVSATLAAFVVVVALGISVSRSLQHIPEHVVKYAAGALLVTYGTFWAAEGIGVRWPEEDVALLAILGLYILYSLVMFPIVRQARTGHRKKLWVT